MPSCPAFFVMKGMFIMKISDFTTGKLFLPLIMFALPVLLAMLLQVMYGAVDLVIVGQWGNAPDILAVASGSQVMLSVTSVINGLAMGVTILIGQMLGSGRSKEAGNVIGSAIAIFLVLAVFITATMLVFAGAISNILHVPGESFGDTVLYLRICGAGSLFIVAFNVIGSIFRGLGDSKTPLIVVTIACVVNIIGDVVFVAGFHLGVMGAALATVIAQATSVVLATVIIKKQGLPFEFSRSSIRFHKELTIRIIRYGAPIALQDGLVSLSFLAITTIVNSLGVIAAAGVGVAERLAGFIMLVPSAFSQAVAVVVAQNYGAKEYQRARKTLLYGIAISLFAGTAMAYLSFFHGNLLSGVFSNEIPVINASWEYLKAYAIDCLLTAFLFCLVGYFNGCSKANFVMVQGIIGAFGIRIPMSYLFSQIEPLSLFRIGLATPSSTLIQVSLCIFYFLIFNNKLKRPKVQYQTIPPIPPA